MISRVFRPNIPADANRKYPISLNKLRKGDAAWFTCKTILVWYLDTEEQLLRFPESRSATLRDYLRIIPSSLQRQSLQKWRLLIGLFHSIMPAVEGSQGMSTRFQHALNSDKGRQVQLTFTMNKKLQMWVCLLEILESHPLTSVRSTLFHPPCLAPQKALGQVWAARSKTIPYNCLYGAPPFPPPRETSLSPLTTQ